MFPARRMREALAVLHLKAGLRWPTLLAIALSRPLRRRATGTVRSVLLVRTDGLGDCVLTLPLAEALGACFPHARLTVVTQPSAVPLFAALPCVHETLPMPLPFSPSVPKYLRGLCAALRLFGTQLRGRRFDVAVMPRWDADIYHATLLCALTRTAVTVGYADHTTEDKLLMNRGFQRAWTRVLPPGPLQHELLRNLRAARALGCVPAAAAALRLPLTSEQRREARAWLGADVQGYLGVGLSSAEAKKRWPAGHFAAALAAVVQRTGLTPVLFADAESKAAAETIHTALPQSRIAQTMPLMQVAAVLAECRIFLGNDSGLGHLAAAVGCPTVTVFSQAKNTAGEHRSRHSTSPQRFRPFGRYTAFLQPALARPGCEGGCTALEPHCIADVSPSDAAGAVLDLLERSEQAPRWHEAPALRVVP